MKAADRNTKYFQARATHQRRKNTIGFLKDADGRIYRTNEDMSKVAKEYFEDLFTSDGVEGMDQVLSSIQGFVTNEMIDCRTGRRNYR